MEINDFAKMSYERAERSMSGKVKIDGSFQSRDYLTVAMSGEAGEALNKFKKYQRGDYDKDRASYYANEEYEKDLAEEAVDVITYALLLLADMDKDPEQEILAKYEKVNRRLEAGGFHARPGE